MIMIKKQWIWAIWAIGMLSACSNEDIFAPETPQSGSGAIELTVSTSDFVTDGAPHTRATDNGNTITFESGDRIGLIIVADNGTTLVANNLPYKYNGESWAFDTGNNESKTIPYYNNRIKDVTYIAYFPYSSSGVDKVTTLDALKEKFIPKNDQRSEANYRASDLMVWTSGVVSVPQKKLDIALTHAYASISLSPKVKYTLDDGKSTVLSYVPSRVSDVCFTVGGDVYYPFQAKDGNFRCILPAGTSAVRWFYTFDGKTYGSFNDRATANTRYVRQEIIDRGVYGLDKARAGDFYCKNSSSEGYLVPDDAPLSAEQKKACLGIVYWVGDIKGDNYGLLNSKLPDSMHGLVVSLWNMPDPEDQDRFTMTWTYENTEYVSDWLSTAKWSGGNPRPENFKGIQVWDKMQGYANTIALIEYNKKKLGDGNDGATYRAKPVEGLDTFEKAHPAPLNSSGWYWPSVCELKYVCWGQGNGRSTKGKAMLNTQIKKVSGGNVFGNDKYLSSTEDDRSNWYYYVGIVNFKEGQGYASSDFKWTAYRVRPLLAF